MPKVLVLPDHIASQIAAGEVVERPASVVKELVENSVDAGATEIEIAISHDCRDIRIADNGFGMEPEDAILAFQRHATSKLRTAEDLWSLNTLGFRGEAIPSIASISKFVCYTRTHDAAVGTRVETADGQLKAVEVGCAPGTVMEIHELFYNTPARLKFMKKAATEFGHIEEAVQSLAISYPQVAFTLLNNGDVVLRTSGQNDLARTIVEAKFFTGKERLVEVIHGAISSTEGGAEKILQIKGYLAKPTHFRGDRKGILTIVNGRAVRCPLTLKALDYAFSDLIPRGRYPLAVVVLQMDPGQVDVNIHPTKKELKYSHGNEIYLTIQRALGRALREESIAAAEAARAEHVRQVAQEPYVSPDAYNKMAFESVAFVHETPSHQHAEQISFRDSLSYQTSAREAVPQAYSGYSDSGFNEAAFNSGSSGTARESSYATPMHAPAYERELVDHSAQAKVLPEAGHTFLQVRESGSNSDYYSLPADWKIVGYLHNTYIFVETANGLERKNAL